MKNKFSLFALLALFLIGSHNIYAQESDTATVEEVVEETITTEEAALPMETHKRIC